jgi:hypothetical protein
MCYYWDSLSLECLNHVYGAHKPDDKGFFFLRAPSGDFLVVIEQKYIQTGLNPLFAERIRLYNCADIIF